jgi:predicted dehydrogenase
LTPNTIIGCGWAGRKHAEAYHGIDKVKVVAVSDLNMEGARAFAHKFNIAKVYGSYEELIQNENIDLVDICTPTSTHRNIVMAAIKKIPNILLEKPMARTSDECDEIISAGDSAGARICVCHNRLFFPEVIKAKLALRDINQEKMAVRITFQLPGFPVDNCEDSGDTILNYLTYEYSRYTILLCPEFLE